VSYVNVAPQAGLSAVHESTTICSGTHYGSGSAWADIDNDGDIDLFTTNHGGANHFYRNDGDGNSDGVPEFTDIAVSAGVDDASKSSIGSVFIDFDNDGDQDLYVTHYGTNSLYQNRLIEDGGLAFVDVTGISGLAGAGGRTLMSAWGDYDQDGYLDVYITKHQCFLDTTADQLFHNDGDGSFTEVSDLLCSGASAPCDAVNGLGFAPAWLDYDNDGDADLYQANDNIRGENQPNKLWRNDGSDGTGGWIFTNVSVSSMADLDDAVNSMGLGVGDYDNNGHLDLAVSDVGPAELLKNLGTGAFENTSASSNVTALTGGTTWGTVFFDFDNDGWLDLYLTQGGIEFSTGQSLQLEQMARSNTFIRNNADGTFSGYSVASGLNDDGVGRNASIVDINRDGYVDVLLNNLDTAPRLYLNQEASLGNPNHWLVVTVEGTISNRDAIGTRLILVTAGLSQIREITSGPTHGGGDYRAAFFGMGGSITGTLSIRWPDGITQTIGTVNADHYVHYVEPNAQARQLAYKPAAAPEFRDPVTSPFWYIGPATIGIAGLCGLINRGKPASRAVRRRYRRA
jgi:hypothetical protein